LALNGDEAASLEKQQKLLEAQPLALRHSLPVRVRWKAQRKLR